jgi:1,2-phenylacetyl-CoA epoxidase catalytic subunit
METIESPRHLTSDEVEFLKDLLFLQGDIEYGIYNLHLEWQSKDHTSAEERWRMARIVTDEVGHGLNITRLLKRFDDTDDLIDKLNKLKIGNHQFDVFNNAMKKYSEIIVAPLFLTRVDYYNLQTLKKCTFTPLTKLVESFLNEEQLHFEFARNSILDVLENDGVHPLGSKEAIQEAINKYASKGLDLYNYGGKLKFPVSDRLNISFSPINEIKTRYINDIQKDLENIDLTLPEF